jgi:HEAT repeat protein
MSGIDRGMYAQEPESEAVWQALPKYEYGQDMATLLAMDRLVIDAMGSDEARRTCAARLAQLLTVDGTTAAAKQYICCQLRQVGTPAEVPLLERLLGRAETSEMARQALQAIPGPESLAALRKALPQLQGKQLVGVVNALAARRDALAVPALQSLVESGDQSISTAATLALGSIANQPAMAYLSKRAAELGPPTPRTLATALLRSAAEAGSRGDSAKAGVIYEQLSQPDEGHVVRRAALEGMLRLQGAAATETVIDWLAHEDPDRERVAAGHLGMLSGEQLDQLLEQLHDLPGPAQLTVLGLAAQQRGKAVLPTIMSLLESDAQSSKLAGIRGLGVVGDAAAIPPLMDLLGQPDPLSAAAKDALTRLPRQPVAAALLETLRNRPELREPVIAVLVELKCYEAIDPLIEIATQTDSSLYTPALEGLRGIADPDKTDIPRLVKLLLASQPGSHRDEVEKTILLVTQKLPEGADRSALVRAALKDSDRSQVPTYLPLLGRLGGKSSLQLIQSALGNEDPLVREAAVRALCNWPTADVAPQLWEIAGGDVNDKYRRWALRAYIRVTTLASDRSDAETLAMLKNAMQLAQRVEDQQLILQRSSTVRTLATVDWLATFLDDPQLNQVACRALVDLAHHRFLRHPNMKKFDPLLEKVSRISEDAAVVERANRYRLGL